MFCTFSSLCLWLAKNRSWRKLVVIVCYLIALPSPPALSLEISATHSFVRLPADYISMTAVRSADKKSSKLIVFVREKSKSGTTIFAETLVKQGDALAIGKRVSVPADAAAFDVCQLASSPDEESIVLIRPAGLYVLGASTPLISTPTVFAHKQETSLPRIRVCFAIYRGESPTFLIPKLAGLAIYRQQKSGALIPAGNMEFHGELRHQSPLIRGEELNRTQRIMFRLDLPDVSTVDISGDGLVDICLTVRDRLRCRIQDSERGLSELAPREVDFDAQLLSEEEHLDTNIRVESKVVDITGDQKPDFIVSKTNWNLAALGTTLSIYPQGVNGGFASQPTTSVTRRGYFSYQEYFDFDGDGLTDIVAPYADIDWTALASVYLTRKVAIDFIWFKNKGGRFDPNPLTIHSITYPVEFKNIPAILGALPLWPNSEGVVSAKSEKLQSIIFFPKKAAIEWRSISQEGRQLTGKADTLLGRHEAPLGSDSLRLDMDHDGRDELVFGYPRDPMRQNQILFVTQKP